MITADEILEMHLEAAMKNKRMFCSLYSDKIHCSYSSFGNKFFIRETGALNKLVPAFQQMIGVMVGPEYMGGFMANVSDIERIWIE